MSEPLWSDKRIIEEAKKGLPPTPLHPVITRAYAVGLCIDIRDEYEAELAKLRAELDHAHESLQRFADDLVNSWGEP